MWGDGNENRPMNVCLKNQKISKIKMYELDYIMKRTGIKRKNMQKKNGENKLTVRMNIVNLKIMLFHYYWHDTYYSRIRCKNRICRTVHQTPSQTMVLFHYNIIFLHENILHDTTAATKLHGKTAVRLHAQSLFSNFERKSIGKTCILNLRKTA